MARGNLIVGYESALSFWRSTRLAATSSAFDEVGKVYGGRLLEGRELAEYALRLCDAEPPLTVAVGKGCGRYGNELLERHRWSGPLGAAHLFSLGGGVSVCRPEVVFVQLAQRMDVVELAEIAYELTGTYGIAPWTMEGTIQDVSPLVSVVELGRYVLAARALGVRGAARASEALDLVFPSSNSPMETLVAIFLAIPRTGGGCGLGEFEMNPPIMVPESDGWTLTPDFCWHGPKVVLEYDSSKYHLTPEARARDERRRRAFERAGYRTKSLTPDVLVDSVELETFIGELETLVAPRRRTPSTNMVVRREELRQRLFGVGSNEAAFRLLNRGR